MKKSEIYHLAQLAALRDSRLSEESCLEILGELISRESLELFSEEQAAKREAEKGE